jgi:hypothetical protein
MHDSLSQGLCSALPHVPPTPTCGPPTVAASTAVQCTAMTCRQHEWSLALGFETASAFHAKRHNAPDLIPGLLAPSPHRACGPACWPAAGGTCCWTPCACQPWRPCSRQFMLSADCGTLLPFGGACPAVWYTSLSFPESARTAQL